MCRVSVIKYVAERVYVCIQKDGFGMPKKKTNKATAKRFRKTATGKIKYAKAGAQHLLSCKSRKRKRRLRAKGVLSKVENKRIKDMLYS